MVVVHPVHFFLEMQLFSAKSAKWVPPQQSTFSISVCGVSVCVSTTPEYNIILLITHRSH